MSPAPLLCVLTGAGVSAESGLPTFRGAGGLWEGARIEDVASPGAWRATPERVWRFYQERRAALRRVEPNPAHLALAEFERRAGAAGAIGANGTAGAGFLLVTQNVDDLHERAGSRRPLHMHGELARLRCERCGQGLRDLEHLDPHAFVPCTGCGHARLRPDVVWFGEIPYHLDEISARLAGCTHFLAVGTSGVVWPAAGFLAEARAAGARTLVQALEAPENLAASDRFVPGRASEALPALLGEILAEWGLGEPAPAAPLAHRSIRNDVPGRR